MRDFFRIAVLIMQKQSDKTFILPNFQFPWAIQKRKKACFRQATSRLFHPTKINTRKIRELSHRDSSKTPSIRRALRKECRAVSIVRACRRTRARDWTLKLARWLQRCPQLQPRRKDSLRRCRRQSFSKGFILQSVRQARPKSDFPLSFRQVRRRCEELFLSPTH